MQHVFFQSEEYRKEKTDPYEKWIIYAHKSRYYPPIQIHVGLSSSPSLLIKRGQVSGNLSEIIDS